MVPGKLSLTLFNASEEDAWQPRQQGCTLLPARMGTGSIYPAPCLSRGSHPSQAQLLQLYPVVPPSSETKLGNVVFRGARKKKGGGESSDTKGNKLF